MDAFVTDSDRSAPATILVVDRDLPLGSLTLMPDIHFDRAEAAFAEAVRLDDSGEYEVVRVRLDKGTTFDMPQIREILKWWRTDPA